MLHKYYENDYLCYVRVVTDADEEVLEHNDYSGFGQRLESSTGSANRYSYNGKEEQVTGSVGLTDYGARFYDNTLPRWTTPDPLAEKYYSTSPYVFCNNSPVNFVDPDGKSWYDTVIGYAIGATTNIVPGTSRLRDSYSPDDASDYNSALRTADNTAEAVGEFITVAGMKVTAVGMTAAASGMMMMSNSAANKSGGYEELSRRSNKTKEDVKLKEKFRREYEHWKKGWIFQEKIIAKRVKTNI